MLTDWQTLLGSVCWLTASSRICMLTDWQFSRVCVLTVCLLIVPVNCICILFNSVSVTCALQRKEVNTSRFVFFFRVTFCTLWFLIDLSFRVAAKFPSFCSKRWKHHLGYYFVNSAKEMPTQSLKLLPLPEFLPSLLPLLGRTSLSRPVSEPPVSSVPHYGR